ncbi:MAG: asparagine synthase (glutamine-hydrolyzing) [Acidimicrobiales bacterium]|nr:asparagine synthase (glutamine-hydrolyzing) [Acidimicrobiales bacterium]
MCRALAHRGPDSRGVHLDRGVGLGIQRLRVIDLETGDQPVFSEDGSVAVILNGEIYNYRELREELGGAGHRFATNGDTEVIAHLYTQLGPACVSRLHGMFAFALWDAKSQQLMLARDRVGKKPLFYAERPGALTFASELQSLLQDGGIPTDVDHHALDCYLAYQYVPAPMSAFAAVRKLPPASVLLHRDGHTHIERYWELDYGHKALFSSVHDAHEAIRETILASVRRRLVADVPLGAFLSGGIDSSAVVAAMAQVASGPVRTFSIGFESQRFDELEHARAVARQFGTEHHEFVVRPDAVATIPRIVRHHGEPFADSSAIATFQLAELARRHVTVALTGDGGDEAFGGYPRYPHLVALQRLERLPVALRRAGGAATALLPDSGSNTSTISRARRLAQTLAMDTPHRYVAYLSSMGGGLHRNELYTPEYQALAGPSSGCDDVLLGPWRESSGKDLVDVMLDVDTRTYLPGDLLVKMDIATMASSLEARSPLLDHEFLALAASFPSTMKVRGGETKVGLRAALRAWLPDDILDRPKQGFEVPVSEWFRSDLRHYVEEVLLDPGTIGRGYFRETYVHRLLDRHSQGLQDNSRGLWTLLMFELWHREFVDRRPSVPLLPAEAPTEPGGGS